MDNHRTMIALCCVCLCFFFTGCGDKEDPIRTSDATVDVEGPVTYSSHIRGMLESYCLGCHSDSRQGSDRKGAPVSVNFDTYEDIVAWADNAGRRIQSGTMPPGGGISDTDRALFRKWTDEGMLKDSDQDTSESEAFVATPSTFANYKNWQVADNVIFPVNASLLGDAHQGNNSDYARWICADPMEPANGEYPVGTVIAKETFSWSDGNKQYAEMGGLLAMVKCGGDFNPEGSGWEWFGSRKGEEQCAY